MYNLLCLHHSFNCFKPTLNLEMMLFKSSPTNRSDVSSANKTVKIKSRKKAISFIKIMNNNGPRTEPCGTPDESDIL